MSPDTPARHSPPRAEVEALASQLIELDARLDALLGGEADSVSDAQGRTILLRRAHDHLRHSEHARQAAILDTLPAEVALLDTRGVIVAVNQAWRRFGDTNGLRCPVHCVGVNYLAICEAAAAASEEEARTAADRLRALLEGTVNGFELEYSCHSPTEERWFLLRVVSVSAADVVTGAAVMHIDITDRKRIATELARLSLETERRERMLNTMLSSSADLTYTVSREGRLLYANDACLEVWGVSLQDAVNRTPAELGYPPELARRIGKQVASVFATGKPITDETPFTGASSGQAHYEYIFSPAFGPGGAVEFVVGCSRDITVRKRTEEALRESVVQFQTLSSAMPQIVWVSAGDAGIVYLNQLWMDYTGRGLAESLDSGWLETVHPEDRKTAGGAVLACCDGHADCSVEIRLRRADGAYRWWLFRGVPVRDEAGFVLQCIGTCTDIDDLKRAGAAIQGANSELDRQRTELRALFDLVPAMLWFKDTEGRMIQVNQRAAQAMGLTVDEARGRRTSDLYPEERALRYEAEDQLVIASGRPIQAQLEQVSGPSGTQWFQSDKVPYRDAAGKVIGVIAMKQDITERKRVEEALSELNSSLEARVRTRTAELAKAREDAERANKAKSAFLATMSHEIRTPMTGLLGLLELMELTPLEGEQRATLRVARDSGVALKRIIDGILDFSKIESDSLELDVAPSSIRALVENVSGLYGPIASSKNLLLTAFVAAEVSPVLAFDALRMGQILNNFLANAIKFTERGSVTVRVEVTGRSASREHLRITVADTGIGIAADRIPRLFQPFVQADAQTSTHYGGTGLGLFIARRLAECMGGAIEMHSEPGQGTTLAFSAAFDICADGVNTAAQGSSREQLHALVATRPPAPSVQDAVSAGTLLLVVDDHPINRMVLLRQVSTLGYAAEAAADGLQALEAWASGRFAAIITDCNMPRMNGFELTRAIRAREGGSSRRTPIIGCTANATREAAQMCIEAGMDDAVSKPVTLEDMHLKLDRYLRLESNRQPRAPSGGSGAGAGRQEGPPLLDLGMLKAIAGGDPRNLADVIAEFRRNNDADTQALREVVRAGHLPEAVLRAHRLAGACAMLGATRVAEASSAVEHAAAAGARVQVEALLVALESEVRRLDDNLSSLVLT